jgi:hypothetical protein
MKMKSLIMGPGKPGDCMETVYSAEDLPERVSNIVRRYGINVSSEDITTPNGTRPSSFNLEEGIVIPESVSDCRAAIRSDIIREIGRIPVAFAPVERHDRSSYSPNQRGILEYC